MTQCAHFLNEIRTILLTKTKTKKFHLGYTLYWIDQST